MCGPSELFDLDDAEKRAVMAAFGQMLRIVPLSLAAAPAVPPVPSPGHAAASTFSEQGASV